jgi:hypothetical protein
MSPTKTRKPTAVRAHPRSEIVVAVLVAVGIVLATLLLVWLLRPGEPGVPGGGGLLARQPRATLWVVLGVALLAFGIWWVLNGRRRPKRVNKRTAVTVTAAVVIVLIVLAGIFWPGGLLRQYPSRVTESDLETPIQTAPPSAPETTKPKAPKTSAPGATAVPGAVTPTTTGG